MTDAPLTIAEVINGAQTVIAELSVRLVDPTSATGKRAQADAQEACGALERSVQLLSYEVARQAGVQKARAEAAEAQRQADESKKADDERARHVRVLRNEAIRETAVAKVRIPA